MRAGLTASRLFLALACGVVVLLAFVSAGGVRGSDQYWYVADVESIARGEGGVTNTIFPSPLLRERAAPPYRPIHHHPMLYLVALPAMLVGGYGAWLLLNVAWVLGTALLVRALLAEKVDEPLANLAAALFAVLPAAYWQASQPLADAWIALLVMLCVWSLCQPAGTTWKWPLAYSSLLMAALCREFFALPLLLLPYLYWRWSEADFRRRAARAVGMLVLAAVAVVAKGHLFPQQLEHTPTAAWRALSNPVPGMYLYFDLGQEPLAEIGELLSVAVSRLAQALREHLLPPWRQSVFYLPFNVLAAVTVSGWLSRRREGAPRRLLLICTGLLALHLLTITTQHASFRYGFVITAPLLVATVLRIPRQLQPTSALRIGLWSAALVASIAVDLALADKSRREGKLVQELTVASRQILDPVIGPGEVVAVEAVRPAPDLWYLWAGHLLSESNVLYLDPGYSYDMATYDELRSRSGAAWLISRSESPLRVALRADPDPIASLPDPASAWKVYRLPRPSVTPAPPPHG